MELWKKIPFYMDSPILHDFIKREKIEKILKVCSILTRTTYFQKKYENFSIFN